MNFFRLIRLFSFVALILVVSGCATRPPQPAVVGPGIIQNPTMGFNGYIFNIPPELETADFLGSSPNGTATEQMIVRLFQGVWRDMNQDSDWGKYRFSEAFSFREPDGKTGFLFTVQLVDFYLPVPPFCHMLSSEKRMIYDRIIPKFNIGSIQPVTVGGRQALYTHGTVFEKEKRFYKVNGPGRLPVAYAGCFILGDTRDYYTIVGFADPKDAELLKLNIQRMMNGLSFP